MRVIADSGQGNFLIEAHGNEIAHLIGFYWTGQSGCPPIKVGMSIRVNEMYTQLDQLKRREKQLTVVAKDLRLLADLLELKEPVIWPPEPDQDQGKEKEAK